MTKKRHAVEKQQHDRKLARQAQKKKSLRTGITIGENAIFVIAVVWLGLANWPAKEKEVVEAPEPTSGQYDAPPAMTIDTNKQYFAKVKMANGGEFVIQLFPDKAPTTVNNFVFLAREGYYNDTTFHRVLEDFMAQGGGPSGTGGGGPGYTFEDEANDLTFDKPGVVAMANSGPNTNGSQFFITYAPTEWLNGKHTIFGQVTKGMDVVNSLTLRDPNQKPNFLGDAIASITITEK